MNVGKKFMLAILAFVLTMGQALAQDSIGKGDPVIYKYYKGLEAFGVTKAWSLGITGRGVKVAVIDDGIDFGAPDLVGAQARVENPASPYNGWPIAIELDAIKDFQQNKKPNGYTGYVDTSSTDTKGWKVTGTSKSGVYHIGNHTDRNLTQFYGEPVKVLVVDEKEKGVYDTVYVDLNANRDFTDDKPCRRGDENAVWDRDGDGLSDETGGLLYFIADGVNPPPLGSLLYGKDAVVPKTGELAAFHYVRSGHGTMCAGTIAARGKVVRGIAPEANLIPVLGWDGNEMELTLFASLGYDGIPETGDEANVISRSAGFDVFNKGADDITVFMEYLTTKISPKTTLVYASGNEGSGYGTCSAPSADHVLTAGAIEDQWWKLSSQRGDVVAFSSRGPNVLGKVKPNALGNGEWAPRVRTIASTHNGRLTWDKQGGGTSNATPHLAGITTLIYQAYKQAHGEFPDSGTARDILMSSADDINDEVFAQGAGIMNARRAAEIAMGKAKDGSLIQPALLTTDPVEAGTSLEFKFRINDDPARQSVMKPIRLFKTMEKRMGIGAGEATRLYPVEKSMLTGDLLKVSSFLAMDPALKGLEESAGYWVFLYKWTDLNKDGKYADSPKATLAEAQKGELEIIAGSTWDHIITAEVRLHDPAKRSGNGLVLGLEKNTMNGPNVKSRDVTIVFESYSWKNWEGTTLSRKGNDVTFLVPVPQETGITQGKILVETKGAATKQCIPVSFAAYRKGEIKASNGDEPYEQMRLYGRLEGSGRFGFRDSRFFPVLWNTDELVSIAVDWETAGTDVDLSVFGPDSVDTTKMWQYPNKPPVKLPVLPIMAENGKNTKRVETIWPLTLETKRTITANFKKGLNILVVNMGNSSGRIYGERIGLEIKKLADKPVTNIELKAKAGEKVTIDAGGMDALLGFGAEVQSSFNAKPIPAKKGDILAVRQEGEFYFPSVYYDSNRNGRLDEGQDEVIFREVGGRNLVAGIGDAAILPYDGNYFIEGLMGKYSLFNGRIAKEGEKITFEAPKVPGAYLGIGERDGNFLPMRVFLNVSAGDPAKIEAAAKGRVFPNRDFTAVIRTVDACGNPAKSDAEAVVVFGKTSKTLKLSNGEALVTFKAPKKEGKQTLKITSRFGTAESLIDIRKGASVEITELSSGPDGVKVKLLNTNESVFKGTVYANPASYILPELADRRELEEEAMFYKGGYKNGYLPLAASSPVSLASGEEKEIILAIESLKGMGEYGKRFPFIAVVTDGGGSVVSSGETAPFNLEIAGFVPDSKRAKTPADILKVKAGEPVSFLAEGLVSFKLGGLQPIYLKPTLGGAVAIIPDESGDLTVEAGGRTYKITVEAKSAAAATAEADKTAPAKPEKCAAAWDGKQVILTWSPSPDADIDHYNVFRITGRGVSKAGESKTPEYKTKGGTL